MTTSHQIRRDLAYLYFCECEHSTEADSWTVDEREDVMITLNLFCLGRQSFAVVEPPFRLELLGIWSPYFLRAVYSLDRDNDGCPLFNVYGVDFLSRCGGNRSRKRYIVVLGSLSTTLNKNI